MKRDYDISEMNGRRTGPILIRLLSIYYNIQLCCTVTVLNYFLFFSSYFNEPPPPPPFLLFAFQFYKCLTSTGTSM